MGLSYDLSFDRGFYVYYGVSRFYYGGSKF